MRKLLRWALIGAAGLMAFTIVWAALYRIVPPPATPLMLIRALGGSGLSRDWEPLERISPALAEAVIASEDTGFCGHGGFDWAAIEDAVGSPLFVRRQRGMELTEAGRHFVHHAQAVLAHVGLLEASMNNAGKETRPANQIGILDTA